ncbi:MAG: hypothetical protein HYW49_10710 [Deltaproteobacteria bacterium]|nr:hypothetical protein [Deltaproteobacteria bacterium]
MSDLKIVLYKDNRAPKSLTLSTRLIYQTLFLVSGAALLLLLSLGLALRFYLAGQAKTARPEAAPVAEGEDQPAGNSIEDQNRALKDQVDLFRSKLANQAAVAAAPKELDKNNPALALFAPTVTDKTKDAARVLLRGFKIAQNGAKNVTMSFELHNPKPEDGTQKGYIVVLGRADKSLFAYPDAFATSGPYLLDFEQGETFSIARFRMVNAQFELPFPVDAFQIFIFTRTGELLVNMTHEVKK